MLQLLWCCLLIYSSWKTKISTKIKLVIYCTTLHKSSSQSVYNVLSNVTNRQTNRKLNQRCQNHYLLLPRRSKSSSEVVKTLKMIAIQAEKDKKNIHFEIFGLFSGTRLALVLAMMNIVSSAPQFPEGLFATQAVNKVKYYYTGENQYTLNRINALHMPNFGLSKWPHELVWA